MIMTRSLVIMIILLIGAIWLQIRLSKHESKWPGLVLPILNLLWATYLTFVMSPIHDEASITVDGVVVEFTRTPIEGAFWQMLFLFSVLNIGTIILLTLYASCLKKIELSYHQKHKKAVLTIHLELPFLYVAISL